MFPMSYIEESTHNHNRHMHFSRFRNSQQGHCAKFLYSFTVFNFQAIQLDHLEARNKSTNFIGPRRTILC